MRQFLVICISSLFLLTACTKEEAGKTKESIKVPPSSQADSSQTNSPKPEIKQKVKTDKANKEEKKSTGKRNYKFPSMMVKEDMYHRDYISADRKTSLLTNLVVNRWEVIKDKYGRHCQYASPIITYAELKEYLHFNDSDVAYVKDSKPGEPQAVIQTEWLTCKITFLDKVYEGKDRSVKLKAVLIDREVQANADREAEYDRNKGFIRKILDLFDVVHK